MSFVLVHHLDPKHVSLLPELLARTTTMPVVEVRDGLRIEPNHVYVMPPNYSLAILHGTLHLMPRPDEYGKHLPIDDFLRLLAQDQQSNAIGVILSGTALDGTLCMKAIKARGKVRKEGIRTRRDSGDELVNLHVMPLAGAETAEMYYLVLFESASEMPVAAPAQVQADAAEPDDKDLRIKELESELHTNREYMQSIIEVQEATNEDLQSANEEIQSTNEELQSTNEELETAKEELQSTNEELATINEEHENRNQELTKVNDDLANLLASVELAIVILSDNSRIRRFTPAARPLLNLIDTDIGRPIGNIRSNVNVPDLENQVLQVIDTMTPLSREVQDREGRWYSLRIRPYKTMNNRIEGVVMTFIDIDSSKQAERLRESLQQERRLAAVVRDSNDAVMLQDFAGRILAWNPRAHEMYGYSEDEALKLNGSALIPEAGREAARKLIERIQRGENVPPCEARHIAQDGREFKVWMLTSILLDEPAKPSTIAITERAME
jgi:two-component system CheB/CheR fusion protein